MDRSEMIELASRSDDGIDVQLFWGEGEQGHELKVFVNDWKTEDFFEVPANPENALDVFNHPYAYYERVLGEVALGNAA